MFRYFRELKKRRTLKKTYLALLTEVEDNLEAYYVMFQINRLRYFSLDVYASSVGLPGLTLSLEVQQYAVTLQNYNEALKYFKDYETWYAADPDRKTQENSRLLHERQVRAKELFSPELEDLIKSARDVLAEHMQRAGYLKVQKKVPSRQRTISNIDEHTFSL